MAVSAATTTLTTMDKLVGQSWSPETNDAIKDEMVWPQTFTDISYMLKTGDTINYPYMFNLTPQTKSSGWSNTITPEAITPLQQTISTLTHHYVSFDIEEEVEELQSYPIRAKLSGQIAYALDLGVEQTCAALPSGWTGNAAIGTIGVELSEDDVLQMHENLDLAGAKSDGRSLIVSGQGYTGLLKIESFKQADYNGDRTGKAVRDAYVGHVYEFDVIKSMQCKVNSGGATGHDMSAHYKKAAYTIFKPVVNRVHYDEGRLAWVVTGRHLFKVVTANRIPEGGGVADTAGTYTADDKYGQWVKGM